MWIGQQRHPPVGHILINLLVPIIPFFFLVASFSRLFHSICAVSFKPQDVLVLICHELDHNLF